MISDSLRLIGPEASDFDPTSSCSTSTCSKRIIFLSLLRHFTICTIAKDADFLFHIAPFSFGGLETMAPFKHSQQERFT